ncbi:MAG: 3-deoxy-7-phosphoheptulonate synthase [Bacteroidetes bacterium]|nr:MAG: 3-deoxy-7-phosphoheptulonate synthase [Bacteroidota bacterium]
MEVQLAIKKLADWEIVNTEKPFLIAGPCSAETEEQTLASAHELRKIGIEVFRAGIWKPRTRPDSFEGVGSIGLKWLQKVKKETGMLISTEVANVKHVYEALRAGIDILWIGARTTANPFAIQEIADALHGMDIPVLVKNPVNPDADLWLGAIERLQKAGITRIGAIHRGFSGFDHSIYRNPPSWQIPIELKRRLPDLPILCDPSHIGGKRELLQSISQKAMDLNYDGLMIESHPDPDNAWSDARQQVSAASLQVITESLVLRQVKPEGINYDTLEDLRFKIDKYDNELLDILQKRMETAEAIGKYKKRANMTILQPSRWEEVVGNSLKKGRKRNLSDRFTSKIFKAIHEESISKQTTIMNGEPGVNGHIKKSE